jgi:dihydroflavonol-4-reductase
LRVLITGATGFLGRHLCERLTRFGHRITAYHRPGSRIDGIYGPRVELLPGELHDDGRLSLACKNQDLVIHAAADIRGWAPDPAAQIRTNVDGSLMVAQACLSAGVGRLIHISSVSAIGIPTNGNPASENFGFNLRGVQFAYHASKKRAEDAVLEVVRKGLDAVIVNPASIFGPVTGPSGQEVRPAYRGSEILRKGLGQRFVPVCGGGR